MIELFNGERITYEAYRSISEKVINLIGRPRTEKGWLEYNSMMKWELR